MDRYEPYEFYAVNLGGAHWGMLLTRGRLYAWVETRRICLSVSECGRITDASITAAWELVEEWAAQERGQFGTETEEGEKESE